MNLALLQVKYNIIVLIACNKLIFWLEKPSKSLK